MCECVIRLGVAEGANVIFKQVMPIGVVSLFVFVCLVFNGASTQDRSICANCGRVKPTQVAKDGQRETMHNS